MHDPFVPDPDAMHELEDLATSYNGEDDPNFLQLEARAQQAERKVEILGRTLFHIPGTIGSYVEPESGSLWWRSVKGWHEHRVHEGPHGKYARLSLSLDHILSMSGCGPKNQSS